MRCRVCGSNNEDGSKFCWNCGNKLTEQSETRSSSVNQPGIQQNSGDVQHNQVGTPPKQVRMPQRQVPPGGFDWENGKKMAEERLQKGKNIADGCVGQLKRVAENQTITDKLKKISKKTWGIIGACVALKRESAEVTLIIRPRRFGKTMGMGMLAHFLIYGPITGGYSMVLKLSTMKHCAVHG